MQSIVFAIILVLWLNHTLIKDLPDWLKQFAIGQATFRISTTGGFWRRERPDVDEPNFNQRGRQVAPFKHQGHNRWGFVSNSLCTVNY